MDFETFLENALNRMVIVPETDEYWQFWRKHGIPRCAWRIRPAGPGIQVWKWRKILLQNHLDIDPKMKTGLSSEERSHCEVLDQMKRDRDKQRAGKLVEIKSPRKRELSIGRVSRHGLFSGRSCDPATRRLFDVLQLRNYRLLWWVLEYEDGRFTFTDTHGAFELSIPRMRFTLLMNWDTILLRTSKRAEKGKSLHTSFYKLQRKYRWAWSRFFRILLVDAWSSI